MPSRATTRVMNSARASVGELIITTSPLHPFNAYGTVGNSASDLFKDLDIQLRLADTLSSSTLCGKVKNAC